MRSAGPVPEHRSRVPPPGRAVTRRPTEAPDRRSVSRAARRRGPAGRSPTPWHAAWRRAVEADERGQDTIEWVLIALLLAVASVAVVIGLGGNVSEGYSGVEECVSMAAGEGRGPPPAPPGEGGRGPPRCRF